MLPELPLTKDLPLLTYFETNYVPHQVNLSPHATEQYRISIRLLNKFHSSPVKIADLEPSLIARFMKWLKGLGRTERTVNNKRQAFITLWKHAATINQLIDAPPRIPKLEEPKRLPQAWDVDQVKRIVESARHSPVIRDWTPAHWEALVLVIYDTSHRIGAILQATRDCLDLDAGTILLSATWTKQKQEILHQLHPDTLEALRKLPRSKSGLLFPWPLRMRAIWPAFRAILLAAGLRAGRKDLFHKLRRTSYTYVYALLGEHAAKEQAGHATNMTASYLDPHLLRKLQKRPSVIDVLPRPK